MIHHEPTALETLIGEREPGKTLPRALYLDPDVFGEDLRRVFHANWLFAGHACEVPNPGDFFTYGVGEEELVVLRDKRGDVRAHFNVCRHRGSRVVLEGSGCARALVCPYHQWVYDLDGGLRNARLMGDGFDPGAYRLRSAAAREVAGLIFVCLSPDDASDFDSFAAAIEPQLGPHGLDRAKVAVRHRYDVRANWKVVVENNRECYHCRVGHPEFCASNFDLGLHGDSRTDPVYDGLLRDAYKRWRDLGLAPEEVSFPGGEPFRVSRFPLKEGFVTESLDGGRIAPLMGSLAGEGVGSLRLITLPNLWAHANCDYAMTSRLTPTGPETTRVDVCFLVHEDAVENRDYDPRRLAEVWKATSEQDWLLCENNHAGIRSTAYEPGPLSPVTENAVEAFEEWYLSQLARRPAG